MIKGDRRWKVESEEYMNRKQQEAEVKERLVYSLLLLQALSTVGKEKEEERQTCCALYGTDLTCYLH